MNNSIKSILIVFLIILLQLSSYTIFIKPIITSWGTSKQEITMPMAGDKKALTITSTRAILINAPKAEVWQWLIQLGADRVGFYSYDFIENALGYKTRPQKLIKPKFKTIKTGDLIRGSINKNGGIVPYNFRVLYVKAKDTFVLNNWGTFLLKKVNKQQTRLIIRTQDPSSTNLMTKVITNYVIVPLHYIMERRTLMGIKARAEAGIGSHFSQTRDIVWFVGICLSGLLIYFLIFIGRGFIQSIVIPAAFSLFWLCSLLLFPPTPVYSVILFLIEFIATVTIIRARIKISPEVHQST